MQPKNPKKQQLAQIPLAVATAMGEEPHHQAAEVAVLPADPTQRSRSRVGMPMRTHVFVGQLDGVVSVARHHMSTLSVLRSLIKADIHDSQQCVGHAAMKDAHSLAEEQAA